MEDISSFGQVAVGLGLRYEVIEMPAVPLEPAPNATDTPRLFLVTLSRSDAGVGPLRFVYALRTFGMGEEPPRLEDVVYYLAVRAWQLVRADSDRVRWLSLIGIEDDDAAAAALFAQQLALVNHLRLLLGEAGYQALVRSYEAELHEDT